MSPPWNSPAPSPAPVSPSATTEDLLHRCRAGDCDAALRELIRRYLPLVHGAALRRTGGEALAADVAQAVFCDLARQARSLPPRTALGGWLWRHTGYLASRALRAERRRRVRETEAARHLTPPPMTPDSAAADSAHHLLPALDEALHRLPAREQSLLVMRYYEERALADVARALGVTPAAAQKRVERALERLRRLLPASTATRDGSALTLPLLALLLAPGRAEAAALPDGLAARLETAALTAAARPSPALLVRAAHMSPQAGGLLGAAAALVVGGVPLVFLYSDRTGREAPPSPHLLTRQTPPPATPDADPAPGAVELVAEVISVLDREGLNRVAYRKAELILDRVPPGECGEALVMLSQAYPGKGLRTNRIGLDRLMSLLMYRWTPESPAAGLLSVTPRLREEDRDTVTARLCQDWFRKDPAGATDWWRAMLADPEMTDLSPEVRREVIGRMAVRVIADLARRDRAAALAAAAEMDRQGLRLPNTSASAAGLVENARVLSLAQDVLDNPDSPFHSRFQSIMQGRDSPAAKRAAADTVEDPALRRDLAALLGAHLIQGGASAGADAAATADWMMAQAVPGEEEILLGSLADAWGDRDRAAFEAWAAKRWPDRAGTLMDRRALKRLEGGHTQPEAIAAAVHIFRDADLRSYALARLAARAMDQPEGAERLFRSDSLPAESVAALRQLLHLQP